MVVRLQPDEMKQPELYVMRVGYNMQAPLIFQPWNEFRITRSERFSDIWHRHLYCNRDDEFIQKTQEFVQTLIENPFVIDKKKKVGSDGSAQQRLYRNAELLAEYYKYVEFLPNAKESYKYEVKDFSQHANAKLIMLKQASFGDEQVIMFNEKEINEKITNFKKQIV